MPNHQKLELTWIANKSLPKPQPHIRVEFHEDMGRADSPIHACEAELEICAGPRCSCLNILFRWAPCQTSGSNPAQSREFWFDLHTSDVRPASDQKDDLELRRLGEVVRTELTEEDRQRLREWYLAAKLDLIQGMPVAQIPIDDLPNADRGEMIGFVDVFPCGGLAMNFQHDNAWWAVDEQYCVQPGCRCSETVLSFFRIRDAAGNKSETIRHAPTLRYDYHKEAVVPLERPRDMPSPEELLAKLKREQADLNQQLAQRHLIMQLLYARHYRDSRSNRFQTAPVTPSPPKVGRNDPCPCGSGRKYKHCCLKQPRV